MHGGCPGADEAPGNTVSSRAAENRILCNRLMDERDGNSSYVIDLPNGGRSFLIGNVLHHGPAAEITPG